ncbi:MAG TPA: saccharopine dehydrogenase NADP-binding domain-containing protein [Marmoricola sp.]|nr:saccharopine dehydrogenase NADP-binding domain-containing protein [Marmoricola sp.]
MTWMLYGANGYTGTLLARLAVAAGERPVLAGRSSSVAALAAELGTEHRVFDLASPDLDGITSVLHCAGPFSRTSAPMVEACLAHGVHYLDLTGEIEVFESVYARHDEALAAGVSLIPGVGYDVVPTDHLLARLYAELPTATAADVVLISRGGFSSGTLRTAVEGMRTGNLVRSGGAITPVRTAHRTRRITIDGRRRRVASLPLGDVSSGYRATGIGEITNFTNLPAGRLLGLLDGVNRVVLGNDAVHGFVDRALARLGGPSEARRAGTRSDAWAELSDPSGSRVTASIRIPNTYDFTAHSALAAVRRTEAGDTPPGAWAPSQALGTDFLRTIPDIDVEDLTV